jgi:hypothetical protein
MKEGFEATLWVNNEAAEVNAFVEEFLARTVVGAASSLKGPEDVESLELYLEHGDVRVIVNGKELLLTPFPNAIIASTLVGLVSSLKGVDRVESLRINVRRL